MKKVIAAVGMFCAVLICFGTMFKIMHWPGAGPLLVVGLNFFATFFIPLVFIKKMMDEKSGLSWAAYIFAMVSTCIIFNGVLFKIMHWPGAGPMIVLGTTAFVIGALPLYIFKKHQEEGKRYTEFIKLVFMVAAASVFLIFWGTGPSRSLLDSFSKVTYQVDKMNDNVRMRNVALVTTLLNTTNAAELKRLDTLTQITIAKIRNLRYQLIENSEKIVHADTLTDYYHLSSADNIDMPYHILIDQGAASILKQQLEAYKAEVLATADKLSIEMETDETGIILEVPSAFNNSYDAGRSWEDFTFLNLPLAATLTVLSNLENEVLNAENILLEKIRNKKAPNL